MSLYNDVFNAALIYDMLFVDIQHVLIHKDYPTLLNSDEKLGKIWNFISKTQYNEKPEITYNKYAIEYPEFCKIITITYAELSASGGGEQIRDLKQIKKHNELVVISEFINVLNRMSNDGLRSSPQYQKTICGYNIKQIGIPLLMKRYLFHKENITTNIPFILKYVLSSKPWETDAIIDIVDIWKFNGNKTTSLESIADFLNLKRMVDILTDIELSNYYWNTENSDEKFEFIGLQSATKISIMTQLLNFLRVL